MAVYKGLEKEIQDVVLDQFYVSWTWRHWLTQVIMHSVNATLTETNKSITINLICILLHFGNFLAKRKSVFVATLLQRSFLWCSISGWVWELITFSPLTALPEVAVQGSGKWGRVRERKRERAARVWTATEPQYKGFICVVVTQWLRRPLRLVLRLMGHWPKRGPVCQSSVVLTKDGAVSGSEPFPQYSKVRGARHDTWESNA